MGRPLAGQWSLKSGETWGGLVVTFDLSKNSLCEDTELAEAVAHAITLAVDLEQTEEALEIMKGTLATYGTSCLSYKLATLHASLSVGAIGSAEAYHLNCFTDDEKELPQVRLLAAVLAVQKGLMAQAYEILNGLITCKDEDVARRASKVLEIMEPELVA